MCGIAGAVDDAGTDLAVSSAARLLGQLVHRGPDDDGIDGADGTAIGIRRLSIVDLVRGHQPFASEDGEIVTVGNGEIYNHQQLRRDLAGRHDLRTSSDMEVLPHLYEEHGDDLGLRLRGMFAFAVHDRRRRRLLLVRDRVGIKPLYYAEAPGRFAFASEYRALLALPWVDRSPDVDALRDFAAHAWIGAPRTAVRGIRKLGAGQRLVRDDAGTHVSTWWQRPVPGAGRRSSPTELLELLDEVVESHLMSDVPLGVFLSGGLDSSVVAALAARHAPGLASFTVVFAEDENREDRAAAAEVASTLGLDHRELPVDVAPASLLRSVARHHDDPVGDMACLPTWSMAEAARQHATVVLTGEGGDEAFAGYGKYGHLRSILRAGAVPAPLRSATATVLQRMPGTRRATKALALVDAPDLAGLRYDEVFTASERAALFLDRRSDVGEDRAPTGLDPLDAAQWHDLGPPLSELLNMKLDKMTMAHSLEARVPFLDHELLTLAVGLPPEQRFDKALLRRAVADLVPAVVRTRPKRGFTVPMARWLRHDLRSVVGELLDRERIESQGIHAPAAVAQVVDDHLEGRADRTRQLWNLLAVQLWFDEVLA